MDSVDRTLTTLRKKRATGTGNHMLLIFHLQKLAGGQARSTRSSKRPDYVKCPCFESPDQLRSRAHIAQKSSAPLLIHIHLVPAYPQPSSSVIDQSMALTVTFDSAVVACGRKWWFLCFPDIPSRRRSCVSLCDLAPAHPTIRLTTICLPWWANYNSLPGRSNPAPICSFLFVRSVLKDPAVAIILL